MKLHGRGPAAGERIRQPTGRLALFRFLLATPQQEFDGRFPREDAHLDLRDHVVPFGVSRCQKDVGPGPRRPLLNIFGPVNSCHK